MSLLKMLMEAKDGQGLGQLAKQLGMNEEQAGGLAGMLAPAIAQGAKKRTQQSSGGLEAVLGQLTGEAQGAYLDDPVQAAEPQGRAQGEQFLEQIFGSREASQDLAAEAANRTGVSPDIVSKFLPAIAAMLQGGMQRQVPDRSIQEMVPSQGSGHTAGSDAPGGGLMDLVGGLFGGSKGQAQAQAPAQQSGGGLDMLTSMLDADGDGSAMDDILERFMKR